MSLILGYAFVVFYLSCYAAPLAVLGYAVATVVSALHD